MEDSDEIGFFLKHTEDEKDWMVHISSDKKMSFTEFLAALIVYVEEDLKNMEHGITEVPAGKLIN